jgi:hypothetical protein
MTRKNCHSDNYALSKPYICFPPKMKMSSQSLKQKEWMVNEMEKNV